MTVKSLIPIFISRLEFYKINIVVHRLLVLNLIAYLPIQYRLYQNSSSKKPYGNRPIRYLNIKNNLCLGYAFDSNDSKISYCHIFK